MLYMKKRGVYVLVCFLLMLMAAVLGGFFAITFQDRFGSREEQQDLQESTPEITANDDPTVSTVVAEEVSKAVVGVSNLALQYNWTGDVEEVEAGSGSGVIFDERGYIVTNNHVVQGSSKVRVSLADGREFTADIIGTDVRTDLALLKINGTNLPVATLGDSDTLRVGEQAIAIGNPGGLDFAGSVTSGIISGLNRPLITEEGLRFKLIQTDAAINPGNSGGALVNSEGKVVGINTAKISQTGFEGMGFSLPSNLVDSIIRQLMDKGVVERPALGLYLLRTVDAQFAEYNKLGVDYGVLVSPQSGGPAAAAGMAENDIVIAINGEKIADVYDLQDLVFAHQIGESVEVTAMRGSEKKVFTVILEKLEDTQ